MVSLPKIKLGEKISFNLMLNFPNKGRDQTRNKKLLAFFTLRKGKWLLQEKVFAIDKCP